MRPSTYSQTASGISATPIVMDHYASPFNVTIGIAFSGTATAKAQFTLDDPASFASAALYNSGAVWYDHITLTGLTANSTGNIAFPVRAIRTNVTAYTSGAVTTTIIQAGMPGRS
jgi:hypothetical protein